MPIDYQKQLNTDQFKAVVHQGSPLLILAGAGSGKTRTLVYRTAHLIDTQKIKPQNILLLTFTNKAAEEMQKRLKQLLNVYPPFAGTFHRFCALTLRKFGHHINLPPNFLIYDTTDQLDLIKACLRELNLPVKENKPGPILGSISNAKNELITVKQYEEIAKGPFQEKVAIVYRLYQQKLENNHAVDFDDLLNKTIILLKSTPQVLKKLQNTYTHILVDEYQDTNKAQYQIVKLLASNHQNLTVVGDASQSIYRWRGADYKNLDYLLKDFPNTTTIKLEQNYRSTQTILDVAFAVIQHNTTHPILSLWTDKKEGDKPTLFEAEDQDHEAEYIVSTYQNNNLDTAVLYRTNAQSRAFEEVCIRTNTPYLLVGGVKFYDRKEIKDVLAYLRLLVNPQDEVSLLRAQKNGKRRLQAFQLQAPKISLDQPPQDIFDQALHASNYLEKLDPKDEQDLARIENIKELAAVASRHNTLEEFLESVALVENLTQAYNSSHKPSTLSPQSSPLVLMTIHASKGLEFDQVFVTGLEEGVFPHSRSMFDPHQIEEERRLCYVALTRAKSKLTLTYTRDRVFYGGHTKGLTSRFIEEIPSYMLQKPNLISSSPKSKLTSLDNDLLEKFLNDEINIDELIN